MQLIYNGVALHTLGSIEHGGQRYAPLPDATTTNRWRVEWHVTVHLTAASFEANLAVRNQILAGLRATHGQLIWRNDAGADLLNRTATVEPFDWPVAEGGGYRHQTLTLTFAWEETGATAGNPDSRLVATYQPTGGATTLTLGHVQGMNESYAADRVDPLRSARVRAGGGVALRGEFVVSDTTLPVTTRRAQLLAVKDAWLVALTEGSDGRLVYGTLNQVVRVGRFSAEVNDPVTAIAWSLEAEYTRWPNEAGYAYSRYDVAEREQAADGRVQVTATGEIGAHTEVAARAQLAVVLGLVTAAYNTGGRYAVAGDRTVTPSTVIADTDGTVFTRLAFTQEYTVGRHATILGRTLRTVDAEDPRAGMIRRTYSGSVTARHADWQTAYNDAVGAARTLAWLKHGMLLAGTITVEDARQAGGSAGTGGHTVKVDFDFQYQLKSDSAGAYLELTTTRTVERFGDDKEEVGGWIEAKDEVAARTEWNTIRNHLTGVSLDLLVESEQFGESREVFRHGTPAGTPPAGGTPTPPQDQDMTANSSEDRGNAAEGVVDARTTLPPTFTSNSVRHWKRFTFSLRILHPKPAGTAALRFTVVVATDYVALEAATEVSGTVWARTTADAQAAIARLSTAYGTLLRSRFGQSRVVDLGTLNNPLTVRPAAVLEPGTLGVLLSCEFSASYTATLTGQAGVLKCSLYEEIEYSGARMVVQPTAFGRDIIQSCGIRSGRRRLRVSATAATETTARDWVLARRLLLYAGMPATRYLESPTITTTPEWAPRTDGKFRGLADNQRFVQVDGSFDELLPAYDFAG